MTKLGLLGLTVSDSGEAITPDEYERKYKNNEIAKKNLADSEHMRWNAYMICNGYIPSTIDQIRSLNPNIESEKELKKKQEHTERRHCNLTTIDGLDEYKKLLGNEFHTNPDDYDVVKYDYDIMDNCYKIVNEWLDKKIVKLVP